MGIVFFLLRFFAACAGGVLLYVAGAQPFLWAVAFPALALQLSALWGSRAGIAAFFGFSSAACFWLLQVSWLSVYLGPVPFLALCAVMVFWNVFFGFFVGALTRRTADWPGGFAPVVALLVAGLWVLREGVQGVWPYGGFAWGRVSYTQVDGVFASSLSVLGSLGLSGVMVFVVALLIAARPGFWSVAGSALVLVVLFFTVSPQLPQTGSLRVLAVQGNSRSAIFDDRESGQVFADHERVTRSALAGLAASGDRVDLVVWPENSAEFNVVDVPARSRVLSELSALADAPLLVGSVLPGEQGEYTNSALLWTSSGAVARYDKRYPVPFAEYMPHREFYRALAPELVDLVQLDYSAGTASPSVLLRRDADVVRLGLAICFDIVFDEQSVALASSGAEVIVAQTNNADFGRTAESVQQLQIARVRAVESGRSLVNVSTVGVSEIVSDAGVGIAKIKPYTPGSAVADVPLYAGKTWAMRFGGVIAGFFYSFGGAAVTLIVWLGASARLKKRFYGRRA